MQALESVRQQAQDAEAEYAVKAHMQVDAYVADIETLLGEFDSCHGILPCSHMQWVIWVLAQVTGIFCASSHVLLLKHTAGFLHKHPVDQLSSLLLLLLLLTQHHSILVDLGLAVQDQRDRALPNSLNLYCSTHTCHFIIDFSGCG